MDFDFLSPVSTNVLDYLKGLSSQHLGSKVAVHTLEDFPNLDFVKIVLIGVLDNRGSNTASENANLDDIRKEIYSLFPGNWDATIADLGDILSGNTINDTYYALQKVVSKLLKLKIIPIVIGGSQDLTYALYRSYDELEQMVNLVSIDNKFDFGNHNGPINNSSYLSKIVIDEPNNLFN